MNRPKSWFNVGARLGMTAALAAAVVAGGVVAFFESRAAHATAADAERAPPAPGARGAASAEVGFSPADILDGEESDRALPAGHPEIGADPSLGAVDEAAPLPPGHPSVNGTAPHGGGERSPSPLPDLATEPIAPARGARAHTITELTVRRHELAGRKVRVRGQVTKVTPNVQGRTFFHLRDGNPQASGQPTDLIATSTGEALRGQVATFEGVLRSDADIGIGYSYPVLLEDATLVVE
jgi:hypothetical protein